MDSQKRQKQDLEHIYGQRRAEKIGGHYRDRKAVIDLVGRGPRSHKPDLDKQIPKEK